MTYTEAERPVTRRRALQLTEEQWDILTANMALLPQRGLRTQSRVIQALIEHAESKGSWKSILKNAA